MQSMRRSMRQLARGALALALLTTALWADAAQWVNVSGTTTVSNNVLQLTGGTVTAKAQVTNIAVTPGQQYTLTGQIKNSTGSVWTYIGLNNAGVITERGSNSASYVNMTPIVFTATASTVSVYGSFWQGQSGTGYVQNVELNGVSILTGTPGGGGDPGDGGAYSWTHVSGLTTVNGTTLELTGSAATARAEFVNVAVTPGSVYTVTGNVWNTTGYTYIGVVNGTQNFEQGGAATSSTAITPITFTAAGSTIRVYGSYWQGQTGKGFVNNVKLNDVALLGGGGDPGGGDPGGGTGNCAGTYTLCDDFDGTTLNSNLWYKLRKNWGGQIDANTSFNGGVLPENVAVSNGYLYLEGHGDLYTGPLKGINKNGTTRADGKKVGGGIASKAYLGSGTYEVRMKVLPHFGAVSTIWTFHYREYPSGTPEYVANSGSGGLWVSNHEIDIELPGRPAAAATNISFNYALFNTWLGERESPVEYTTGYTNTGLNNADGNFHVYKFEWRTGSAANRSDSYVKFYVDGVLKRTSTGLAAHVPYKKGRLWLANWFARNWAGSANFDTAHMIVDYVRFTAANDPNDVTQAESYPCDGLVGCQ